ELVKNGAVLRELEAAILAGRFEGPDYQNRILKFQRVFGEDNVIVKVFAPSLFKEANVIADFCETIGVPRLFSALPTIRANVSFSAAAVQLMSRYNESYPVSQDKGYNLLRSEKLPRYIMAAKGAKFSIADAEILAAYDRAISNDKA